MCPIRIVLLSQDCSHIPKYLAIQALTLADDCATKAIGHHEGEKVADTTCEALQLVRRIFEDSSVILTLESIMKSGPGKPTPISKHQFQTRLESLLGRSTARYSHIVQVLQGCFDPIEYRCRNLLGYTFDDALRILEAVIPIVLRRAAPAFDTVRALDATLTVEFGRSSEPSNEREIPAWLYDIPIRRVAEAIECLSCYQSH